MGKEGPWPEGYYVALLGSKIIDNKHCAIVDVALENDLVYQVWTYARPTLEEALKDLKEILETLHIDTEAWELEIENAEDNGYFNKE